MKVGLNRNRDSSVASLLQNDKNRNVILSGAKNLIIFGILFNLFLTPSKTWGEEFKRALPGRTFSFPQDHFSHPEFKTEWWYYSGHLQSLSQDKKSFGYQLTFFRTGLTRETRHQKSKWSIQDLYLPILPSPMNLKRGLNVLKRSAVEV